MGLQMRRHVRTSYPSVKYQGWNQFRLVRQFQFSQQELEPQEQVCVKQSPTIYISTIIIFYCIIFTFYAVSQLFVTYSLFVTYYIALILRYILLPLLIFPFSHIVVSSHKISANSFSLGKFLLALVSLKFLCKNPFHRSQSALQFVLHLSIH